MSMQTRSHQIALLTVIGALVAVILTAIFYIASGSARRAASITTDMIGSTTDQTFYNPSDGTARIAQAEPNQPAEGDPREPWLGADAWREGVQAGQEYADQFPQPQNVQLLRGMTTAQIWVYMQQYVSGALGVGCQYCHDINNFAADPYPEKIAARLMLVMVNDINSNFIVNLPQWQGNYVQCATCHLGEPVDLPAWAPEFTGGRLANQVNVVAFDEQGQPILDPANQPEEIRDPVPLQEAVLYRIYNYQVLQPFDAADPASGRGILAETIAGVDSRDQEQISQSAMDMMNVSLNVSCSYCHNARDYSVYEPESDYAVKWRKSQYMLLLTTWLSENWSRYNILPKDVPVEGSGPLLTEDRQYFQQINGQYFSIPGCYTCHRGNIIPGGAIPAATIPEGDIGVSIFPPAIRGTNQ